MKPSLSTLTILTILSIVLFFPFVISDLYMEVIREQAAHVYQFLTKSLYKEITGFIALGFFVIEMLLTLRKHGGKWKIRLPGSVLFWRQMHIFLGVGYIGIILIHTGGSMGHNFNLLFLIVFIVVTLTAMLGVVAETRILAVPQQKIALGPSPDASGPKLFPLIHKAHLIRTLRSVWLGLHIFFVSVFSIMLGFHVFLAFYFE